MFARWAVWLIDIQVEDEMAKFLVVYKSKTSAREQMANATPEQAKAGMQAWMAWAQQAGPALLDMGAPVGKAATLAGGKTAASNSDVGGFSVMQAESREALMTLLKEHPHFHLPDGAIEVHEYLPLPGM